jgi:hypothetical protein
MNQTKLNLSNLEDRYIFEKNISIVGNLLDKESQRLKKCLSKSVGAETVSGVLIEYDAEIKDCSILKHFPNISAVVLLGKNIESLAGIQDLPKLRYLNIDIKRKRSFDMSALEERH